MKTDTYILKCSSLHGKFREDCPVLTVVEKPHTNLYATFTYLVTLKAAVTLLKMIMQ